MQRQQVTFGDQLVIDDVNMGDQSCWQMQSWVNTGCNIIQRSLQITKIASSRCGYQTQETLAEVLVVVT